MLDPLTELMPFRNAPGPTPAARPELPVEESPVHDARRAKLDLRMSAVLRGAARGYGYQAAELWLLDDSTRRLTRRIAWGVGAQENAPARMLEEADADVAALAGGAVVLECRDSIREWPVPRRATAAACLPVSSDQTIHGVLWFYSDQERDLNDMELEILEIVAGRLAIEIERDRLIYS